MTQFNKQIDINQILGKYNKNLGDQLGRILVLEAENELLKANVDFLENKVKELEKPDEQPEPSIEEIRNNGALITPKTRKAAAE